MLTNPPHAFHACCTSRATVLLGNGTTCATGFEGKFARSACPCGQLPTRRPAPALGLSLDGVRLAAAGRPGDAARAGCRTTASSSPGGVPAAAAVRACAPDFPDQVRANVPPETAEAGRHALDGSVFGSLGRGVATGTGGG